MCCRDPGHSGRSYRRAINLLSTSIYGKEVVDGERWGPLEPEERGLLFSLTALNIMRAGSFLRYA
jgi:hypothetical protein